MGTERFLRSTTTFESSEIEMDVIADETTRRFKTREDLERKCIEVFS